MNGMTFDHDTCEMVPLMVPVRMKAPEPQRVRDYILVSNYLPPTSARIIKAVADYYGVDYLEIKGESRFKRISHPRQLAMHLCRTLGKKSYPQIGGIFGRDHSTCMSAVRVVESRLSSCPDTLEAYRVLREGLA